MKQFDIGCTLERHHQIGIHAIVNARGGQQGLNHLTIEDIEMHRDAEKVRQWLNNRVRFYQFNSRHFRKSKLRHLLSSYADV